MVQFHLGKVLKIIKPGKEVIAADSSVQAIVEMWDKNQLTLTVEASIASELKENDIVMVDYNPIEGVSPAIPKQVIVKALKGKQGKECWDLFKKYHADKGKKKQSEEEPQQGISYSR